MVKLGGGGGKRGQNNGQKGKKGQPQQQGGRQQGGRQQQQPRQSKNNRQGGGGGASSATGGIPLPAAVQVNTCRVLHHQLSSAFHRPVSLPANPCSPPAPPHPAATGGPAGHVRQCLLRDDPVHPAGALFTAFLCLFHCLSLCVHCPFQCLS